MGKKKAKERDDQTLVATPVPNLFYTAIPQEVLRLQPSYVALPPGNWAVNSSLGLRFMSQGTDAWRAAHPGVLSTGRLADTLGFKESRVARRMGCGGQAGHGHMITACEHLSMPLHATVKLRPSCTMDGRSAGTAPAGVPEQAIPPQLQAAIMHANVCKEAPVQAAGTGEGLALPIPGLPAGLGQPGLDNAWFGRVAKELHDVCFKAAREGLIQVYKEWGTVQEAASLYGLSCLFPRAVLHEVGMFVLQPHELPPHWGLSPDSLPPLAASPDALICHPIVCQACHHRHSTSDMQTPTPAIRLCALAQLHAELSACAQSTCNGSHALGHGACMCGLGAPQGCYADPACLRGTRQQCQRHIKQMLGHHVTVKCPKEYVKHNLGSGQDMSMDDVESIDNDDVDEDLGVDCADDNDGAVPNDDDPCVDGQEALVSVQGLHDNHVVKGQSEVMAAAATPEVIEGAYQAVRQVVQSGSVSVQLLASGVPLLLLPPPKIVPMSDIQSKLEVQSQAIASGHEQQAGVSMQQVCYKSASASCSMEVEQQAGVSHAGTSCPSCQGVYMEVVEVKNTVPFKRVARKTGARGRTKVDWVVSSQGPRERIPAYWVPQLQLHMLASRCQSAMLISRSVRGGIRVWRMWRDDEYCVRMIRVISRMYSSYVLPGRTPPPNALHGEPGYQSLLDNSARLAR